MFNHLLFEVTTKKGRNYKRYLDGRCEGFPKGSLVVNRAFPLFCAGIKNIPNPGISDKQSQLGA